MINLHGRSDKKKKRKKEGEAEPRREPSTTSANPVRNSDKRLFQNCPELKDDQAFIFPSLDMKLPLERDVTYSKLLREDEARDSVQGIDSWRLHNRAFLVEDECLSVIISHERNQIALQMYLLIRVLVKAVCKPLASLDCAST